MSSVPNFDFIFVFKGVACWQVLHTVLGLVFSKSKHKKIVEHGNSYAVAFIHAALMASVGVWTTLAMSNASKEAKAFVVFDETKPYYNETQIIQTAAYVFVSWLLFDLSHIMLSFPLLGGIDQIFHHSGFLILTYSCILYGICPFMATWMFCGELSTVPLNLRWFLIKSGRGDTMLMDFTNKAFATLFFLTRVALYWSGLLEFISSTMPLLFAYGIPNHVLMLFGLLIPGGALLNAYWFFQILSVLKARKPKSGETSSSKQRGEQSPMPKKPKKA